MAIKTLFKTIEEIREHITVDISSDFRTIGPYVKQAEKYTTDIIGADLHAELISVVHDENTDEKLIALLEKVRLPLANFAYMLAIAKLNVNVGERGFTVTVSGNLTPASQWRVDDFRNSVKESANDALEDLISFLETNKADYPTWTDSSAYSFQKRFFINNSKDINESVFIDISILQFLELKPFIHQIERSVILPTMCEVLFQTLKTEILSGEISPENTILLETYIKPAICYLAMDKHTPNANYKTEGTRYVQELKNYLNANAITYSDFLTSTCYEDPISVTDINSAESGFFVFGS
jgi:hypothetical protein